VFSFCLCIRHTVCLTPRHGNLSQCCITIPIPILSNPIRLNPVLETPERSSTTSGVTQIISYVLIVYRETEPLHNMILIDLEAVRQRDIVIRCHNILRNTNRVMLPCREVFEGLLFLSRSSLLRRDVDHLPSRRIQIRSALISQEFHPLKNVLEFDLCCHTSCSILGGLAPLWRVGLLRKPLCCPCAKPSDPEWRVK
jgi:hypothetical protein